jgi:hypothetical protein
MSGLQTAYRASTDREGVRARAIELYLTGLSACVIAAELGKTTTPSSITKHLRDAGLGGIHWCPACRTMEET